jgi:hypothetical protein
MYQNVAINDKIGRACSSKKRDLGVGGRIIFNWLLNKQGVMLVTEFMWLGQGPVGGYRVA